MNKSKDGTSRCNLWTVLLFVLPAVTFGWVFHPRHNNGPINGPPAGFRMPAEWEEQECVWLSWPAFPVDGGSPQFKAIYELRGSLYNFTAALVPYVQVRMIVQFSNLTDAINFLRPVLTGPYSANFQFFVQEVTSGDVWVRDWGPIFVRNTTGSIAVAPVNWSYWGYMNNIKPEWLPNLTPYKNMPYQIASDLDVAVYPNYTVSGEGGDRDVNGYGSMITCIAVETQRNPTMSLAQIEQVYKTQYGVTNVIWMQQGIVDDSQTFNGPIKSAIGPVFTCPCTGGHVDEFVRWVDRYTVILADVHPDERSDPIGAENYARMSVNYNILQNSRAEDGTPLTIIRVNLPPPIYVNIPPGNPQHLFYETLIYTDGTIVTPDTNLTAVLASSYMNFLITNNAVMLPQYYIPGRDPLTKTTDAEALITLQKAFPTRKIVPVRVDGININGGGMHCTSQQQPLNW